MEMSRLLNTTIEKQGSASSAKGKLADPPVAVASWLEFSIAFWPMLCCSYDSSTDAYSSVDSSIQLGHVTVYIVNTRLFVIQIVFVCEKGLKIHEYPMLVS